MSAIRWGWVLLGGLLAEVLIFAIVIPITVFAGQDSVLYTAAPASFVGTFMCGWWVARKAAHRQILHGILVGAAATVIYIATSLGRPEPLAFVIAHGFKLVGGAAGAYLSLNRRRASG